MNANHCILLPIVLGGLLVSQAIALDAVPVDIHDRLYPDRWPQSVQTGTLSIPRGAPVTFQFAVRAKATGDARLSVTCDAAGKARVHWLQSVHVEGNTQGSLINRPGGNVPEGWLDVLVRKAPFDTLEVLVEDDKMPVVAGRTHGVVIEFTPTPNTKPGRYEGELRVALGDDQAVVPFAFRVHHTALPDPLPLQSVHWLWPEPVNLTNGEVPEWWSERHWQLLEIAGKQLRRFGDDTVWTPLINFEEPLIQITRRRDGTYRFDYSRFDRWAKLFFGLGFRQLAGRHIVNLGSGSFVFDEATGTRQPLLEDPKDREAWLAFVPTFYDSLHAHLKKRGWLDKYIQHQYDEPKDAALYKQLTALARKHLPGVRTADALNNRATHFTPFVDIAVFSLLQLNKHQTIAAKRNAEGKGVWLYHCTSPYPPYPNRHIDSHLTESRLYPWLAYKLGADGFLFWAANGYRGADEYKTSLGPFPPPKNNQNPGHPPGDNWFYYRSPTGLRPSIRIVSFREGLIDYALLTELAKRDPAMLKKLVAQIAPSIKTYEREPVKYHQARTAMLDALDRLSAKKNDKSFASKLWTGPKIPSDVNTIPFANGIEHRTIYDAREHDYKFLHGAAIINFKGTFFAHWANSPKDENLSRETLQGRRTKDSLGKWSKVEVIGPGFDGPERHSHGVFLEHKGQLWTFCARFGAGAKGKQFDGLKAEAFVLNEKTDKWESRGVVMDNCWPYDQPVLMDNGSYITGGQDKDGLPVIAYSHGDDLTKWTSVLLPFPPELKPRFAEVTVWAEGKHVLAVIRGGGGVAWVSTSDDYGKTWRKAVPSNYPMPRSKAYMSKLSTGQLYVIANLQNRNTLVISVGRPGEMTLCQMWRIRHGKSHAPRFPGRAKASQWSYPYAYEHDGKLYVVYSISKEDCGLSVIPIKSLAVELAEGGDGDSLNRKDQWKPIFKGYIDDIKTFNRALSDADVAALFASYK